MKVLWSLCALSVALTCASAHAVIVSPSNMNGWTFTNYDGSGGPEAGTTGSFVTGPAPAPIGTGSVRFTVGPSGESAIKISTQAYDGTLLSSISQLVYSSYVTSNAGGTNQNNQQATYVQIPVDYTGDGVFDDRLFFEPVYQTGTYVTVSGVNPGDVPDQRGGDGNAPQLGVWETYNILGGGFWKESDNSGGPPLDTLSHFLSLHPTATIVSSATAGGLQFVAGFGGPGDWGQFDGNLDNVRITVDGVETVFDFEPGTAGGAVPEPTTVVVWSLLSMVGMVASSRRRA